MAGLKDINRDKRGRIPQIWTIDSAIRESTKYKSRKDFRVGSNSAYQYLVRKNATGMILLEGRKRHRVGDWDIFCSLKKSKTWSDFIGRFSKDYMAFAKRRSRIHESAYAHLGLSKTQKKWTARSIKKEAKKYRFRSDFSKKSSGAYSAACDLMILAEVCANMKSRVSDYDCIYVWTAEEKDSLILIKVGVTSLRLGQTRIGFVEKKSGLSASNILLAGTDDALSIERDIKKIGSPACLDAFSGSSEFYWVSEKQYKMIERIINNEATKQRMV